MQTFYPCRWQARYSPDVRNLSPGSCKILSGRVYRDSRLSVASSLTTELSQGPCDLELNQPSKSRGYERCDAGPSRILTICPAPEDVGQHVCCRYCLRVSNHFIQQAQADIESHPLYCAENSGAMYSRETTGFTGVDSIGFIGK